MTLTEEYCQKKDELRRWYADRLAELYGTMTFEEIAAKEGLSSWRVRQWIYESGKVFEKRHARKAGLNVTRAKAKMAWRDASSLVVYGCPWSDVTRLTGVSAVAGSRSHPLLKRYWEHRNHAIRLKQKWEISLPQYAEIVLPHLDSFGRRKGAMTFCRIDNAVPYRADNVIVRTLQESSAATNGFAKAAMLLSKRKIEHVRITAELQSKGLTLDEIAVRIGRGRATVCNNLRIAKTMGLA